MTTLGRAKLVSQPGNGLCPFTATVVEPTTSNLPRMIPSAGTHRLIAELLGACPSLAAAWERERADRMDDDPENPLPYLQAAALAQVVVDAYVADDAACSRAVLDRLEQLLESAQLSQADRELLVVGVLEDLQGVIGWAKLDGTVFYTMLGPKSQARWDALVASWADVRRWKAANKAKTLSPEWSPDTVDDPGLRKLLRSLHRPPE